jgi:uncharacterized membrane protein
MLKLKNAAPTVLLLLGCLALSLVSLDPAGTSERAKETRRARARVLKVDDHLVRTHQIIKTGQQIVHVCVASGPHRGVEADAVNYLSGKLELDEFYREGQLVLVEYDQRDGAPIDVRTRGVFRLHWQAALVALFAVLLLGLAGWTGFNALLTFVFTALLLWRVYFPLMLMRWPPLTTGLAITALIVAFVTFSIGGLNRRGVAAFAGTMLGVLVTCGLAVVSTRLFHIHGAVRPYSETLLYGGFFDLDLTRIFIASVFIGSSGAIMDLAMDIASAMHEVWELHPKIGRAEHIRSGLRVGRAVIGTMTTTLLLAYSGAHVTMCMLFIARGLPMATILNLPMVSAEVLNTLVGSLGLVTAAPFTALVAGLLYHRCGSDR